MQRASDWGLERHECSKMDRAHRRVSVLDPVCLIVDLVQVHVMQRVGDPAKPC